MPLPVGGPSDDGIHWEPWNRNQCDTTQKKVYPNTIYLGNPGIHGGSVYRDERRRTPSGGTSCAPAATPGCIKERDPELGGDPFHISGRVALTPHEEMEVHPNTRTRPITSTTTRLRRSTTR